MTSLDQAIPTFIITDRSSVSGEENIINEFVGKDEFELNVIELVPEENNKTSLFNTIRCLIHTIKDSDIEYILICMSDHQFTDNYSKENLFQCISEAKKLEADVLFGEVNSLTNTIRVSDRVFWIENFPDSSFTIMFRSFFDVVLKEDYKTTVSTNNKFLIYPFISSTKPLEIFDGSNEGRKNSRSNPNLKISEQIELIEQIANFYGVNLTTNHETFSEEDLESIVIPTYIINLPERTERLEHIKAQFAGRPEFAIKILEARKNEIGAVGLWESIRMAIEIAIANDDDVIIICEDDHEFTPDYSRSFLLKNIMEAHTQHAEMLLGGICGLLKAVPVTNNRAWISYSHCTQFIVLYKPLFQKILDEPYNDNVVADILLSKMVVNKMVLYPFISVQRYFGYSDVSQGNNDDKEMLNRNFSLANRQLKRIFDAKIAFANAQLIN